VTSQRIRTWKSRWPESEAGVPDGASPDAQLEQARTIRMEGQAARRKSSELLAADQPAAARAARQVSADCEAEAARLERTVREIREHESRMERETAEFALRGDGLIVDALELVLVACGLRAVEVWPLIDGVLGLPLGVEDGKLVFADPLEEEVIARARGILAHRLSPDRYPLLPPPPTGKPLIDEISREVEAEIEEARREFRKSRLPVEEPTEQARDAGDDPPQSAEVAAAPGGITWAELPEQYKRKLDRGLAVWEYERDQERVERQRTRPTRPAGGGRFDFRHPGLRND